MSRCCCWLAQFRSDKRHTGGWSKWSGAQSHTGLRHKESSLYKLAARPRSGTHRLRTRDTLGRSSLWAQAPAPRRCDNRSRACTPLAPWHFGNVIQTCIHRIVAAPHGPGTCPGRKECMDSRWRRRAGPNRPRIPHKHGRSMKTASPIRRGQTRIDQQGCSSPGSAHPGTCLLGRVDTQLQCCCLPARCQRDNQYTGDLMWGMAGSVDTAPVGKA